MRRQVFSLDCSPKLTRYRQLLDVTKAGLPYCLCAAIFTVQFIKESDLQTPKNGGTVLPTVNLTADSESRSLDSYSSFLVTICLSYLVSQIFMCDRQMDRQCGPLLQLAQTLWQASYKLMMIIN